MPHERHTIDLCHTISLMLYSNCISIDHIHVGMMFSCTTRTRIICGRTRVLVAGCLLVSLKQHVGDPEGVNI